MKLIGYITSKVIGLLDLQGILVNTPILLGQTNLEHMQTSHPKDYEKYKDEISNILLKPDYVGINPKDGSIAYVKEFLVNNEFVKVAVRVSANKNVFARSVYCLNNAKVKRFIQQGHFKKY